MRSRGCVGLGAEAVWEETGNPLTVGKRFDPRALTETLARRAGELELESQGIGAGPTVLCTGGFAASSELVTRYVAPAASLRLRASPWSTGDGLDARGRARRGAERRAGRVLRPQHAGCGLGRDASSSPRRSSTAASPGSSTRTGPSSSRPTTSPGRRRTSCRRRRSGRARARTTCWTTRRSHSACATGPSPRSSRPRRRRRASRSHELPFDPPPGAVEAVRVIASITHTIGGLRVDEQARVLRADGSAIDGLWAAGVDAGGFATGGYASGLAQALVLGLAAAEDAPRVVLAAASSLAERERAGPRIARERRAPDLVDHDRAAVVVELVADVRQVAVELAQGVAGRRPDEEEVVVSTCAAGL